MATDFTVIIRVRQRFGDGTPEEFDFEEATPFVGTSQEYPFQCTEVNRREDAILQFQSQGVTTRQRLLINDQEIPGGIVPSMHFSTEEFTTLDDHMHGTVRRALWTGHILIVDPGILKPLNVLRIESAEFAAGRRDDFTIDNAVIFYKRFQTGVSDGPDPGDVTL